MARGNDITGTYLIPVRPMPDRNISTVLGTWVFAHAGTYRQTGICRIMAKATVINTMAFVFYCNF
jgi:hypothetical protein